MAQFLVYRLPDGGLVLDLQSDLVDTPSRVAAPLLPEDGGPPPLSRLEPILEIAGRRFALHAGEMAAIPAALVSGQPVADLRAEDYAIRRALDMLFSGF
ncbi:MAG: CcdB family protein [Pseudomonadota bacterium]